MADAAPASASSLVLITATGRGRGVVARHAGGEDDRHLLGHGARRRIDRRRSRLRRHLRVTYINMAGGPLQARLYAEGKLHPRWTDRLVRRRRLDDGARWRPGSLQRPVRCRRSMSPTGLRPARAMLPADGAYLTDQSDASAGVFLTHGEHPAPRGLGGAGRRVGHGVGLVSPVMSGTAYPVLVGPVRRRSGGSEEGHARCCTHARCRATSRIAATNPLLIGRAAARRDRLWRSCRARLPICLVRSVSPASQVTVPQPGRAWYPSVIAISAGASAGAAGQGAALRGFRADAAGPGA